jgi:membrane protease YdiL (CAAX protease family)
VITNEPSTEQQQTSLPTETAGPLEQQYVRQVVIPSGTETGENPWAVWLDLLKAFSVWIASIVFLIATQFAVAIPYYGYRWATTGPPPLESLTTDKVFAFLSILSVFPAHLLTLGLIWLVVTQGRKYPFWPTIHFEWPKYLNPAVGYVICSLIATVLFILGATATYFWGGSKTQLDALVESSIAARLATAFIAFFTAPLIEELIYRGVLYLALERAVGKIIAVGVVSLLFAGVHVFQYIDNIAVIAVITMLSFTLTIVRAKTGSVLAPFVIHLVFNGIQSIIIALSPFTGWGQTT